MCLTRLVMTCQVGKAKGHNVTTTLNVELTQAAYKALGSNKGAVIAMEPCYG